MSETVPSDYQPLFVRKYAWIFLGRILPLGALFLITVIYSRQLSYTDYGLFQSVWMYANIINVIISFGFASVIFSTNYSFLVFFLQKNRRFIASCYLVLWTIGLTAFYVLARNFSAGLKIWIILFMVIQNIITVIETLLVKRGGEKMSFVINAGYSLLFFGCHLYVLVTRYSLEHLIAAICVLSLVKMIVLLALRHEPAVEQKVADDPQFGQHWAFLGLNEIFGVLSKWVDKVFLLYLLTASDFAIFFNGSFEIPLFGLLISVAGSFMLIEFSANLDLKTKIVSLFRESFTMLSAIVFPLFFFLFFFRNELFAFVFRHRYGDSVPIFAVSIFILPLRINNYSVILQCFSQGKKIMIGSLIDLLIALVLMAALYPVMGSRGVVLSIVISTWCQVGYYLWCSAKVLKIRVIELLPWQKLLARFLLLLGLYAVLAVVVRGVSLEWKLFAGTCFTTIIVTAGVWTYLKTFFKKNYEPVP